MEEETLLHSKAKCSWDAVIDVDACALNCNTTRSMMEAFPEFYYRFWKHGGEEIIYDNCKVKNPFKTMTNDALRAILHDTNPLFPLKNSYLTFFQPTFLIAGCCVDEVGFKITAPAVLLSRISDEGEFYHFPFAGAVLLETDDAMARIKKDAEFANITTDQVIELGLARNGSIGNNVHSSLSKIQHISSKSRSVRKSTRVVPSPMQNQKDDDAKNDSGGEISSPANKSNKQEFKSFVERREWRGKNNRWKKIIARHSIEILHNFHVKNKWRFAEQHLLAHKDIVETRTALKDSSQTPVTAIAQTINFGLRSLQTITQIRAKNVIKAIHPPHLIKENQNHQA